MYGIKNIKISAIDASIHELEKINDFLHEHDGNIIDIKTEQMMYGITRYIFVYHEEA